MSLSDCGLTACKDAVWILENSFTLPHREGGRAKLSVSAAFHSVASRFFLIINQYMQMLAVHLLRLSSQYHYVPEYLGAGSLSWSHKMNLWGGEMITMAGNVHFFNIN